MVIPYLELSYKDEMKFREIEAEVKKQTGLGVDMTVLENYETAKTRLSMVLMSVEGHEEILARITHLIISDMAVTYRMAVEQTDSLAHGIYVNDDWLEYYGVSLDELHRDALIISNLVNPPELKTMGDKLMELLEDGTNNFSARMFYSKEPADKTIWVATTKNVRYGASVILYPGFLEDAAKTIGCGYYVIPASRHEVILVPDHMGRDLTGLKKILVDVNAEWVSEDDKLSDTLYHYSTDTKVLETADEYQRRKELS